MIASADASVSTTSNSRTDLRKADLLEEDNEEEELDEEEYDEDEDSEIREERLVGVRPILIANQPSLTPTPQTPTECGEELISDIDGKVEANLVYGQDQQATSAAHNNSNHISESSWAELQGNSRPFEDRGPALDFASSVDEGGDQVETRANSSILKTYDVYNPEAEYLSDPDFHDERPGKTKSRFEFNSKENLSEFSARTRGYQEIHSNRQQQPSGREDTFVEEFEHISGSGSSSLESERCSPNIEFTIRLPPVTSREIDEEVSEITSVNESAEEKRELVYDEDNQTNENLNEDREQQEDEEEEEEEQEEDSFESEETSKEGSADEDKEENLQLNLSAETHSGHENDRELSLEQAAHTIEEELAPVADSIASCQVTASEAKAELFLDESTLAEDITSLIHDSQSVNSAHKYKKSSESSEENDATCGMNSIACKDIENEANESGESLDDVQSVTLELDQGTHSNERESIENKRDYPYNSNKTKMLIELVSDYCDKLVELIKDEALKQIELIISGENISRLNLSHTFELSSDSSIDRLVTNENNTMAKSSTRRIYTSSLYYNDERDSFPTLEQQVERCRVIAKQLESDSNTNSTEPGLSEVTPKSCVEKLTPRDGNIISEQTETIPKHEICSGALNFEQLNDTKLDESQRVSNRRASLMFKRRRERMNQFTIQNPASIDESCESETFNSRGLKHSATCDIGQQLRQRRAILNDRIREQSQAEDSTNCQLDNNSKVTSGWRSQSIDVFESGEFCFDESGAITDTEYEAPQVKRRALPTRATTTPFRERTNRHVEVETNFEKDSNHLKPYLGKPIDSTGLIGFKPKFKPFLDSSTLKDIERLRNWTPYEEFNEHNSVSPEMCFKLVQDMRSASSLAINNEVVSSAGDVEGNKERKDGDEIRFIENHSAPSKGAQLFEKRQLQSSDWIVNESPNLHLDQKQNFVSQEREDKSIHRISSLERANMSNDICEQQLGTSQQSENSMLSQKHLSRPSLSEENAVLVVKENDTQVIESIPIITSHPQTKLKLATITRTPTYGVSTRRVIECDSPDLIMTPLDDSDNETVSGDLDNDDTNNGNANTCLSNEPVLNETILGEKFNETNKFDEEKTIESSEKSEPNYDRQQLVEDETKTKKQHDLNIVTSCCFDSLNSDAVQLHQDLSQFNASEPILNSHQAELDYLDQEPMVAVTAARVRPQSRAGEIHQATLIEWQPGKATPHSWHEQFEDTSTPIEATDCKQSNESEILAQYHSDHQLIEDDFSVIKFRQPSTFDTLYYREKARIKGRIPVPPVRQRCSSLTHEVYGRRQRLDLDAPTDNNYNEPDHQVGGVAALRENHERLIIESASPIVGFNKYRSYYYPYSEHDRLRAKRSHSLTRYREDSTTNSSRQMSLEPNSSRFAQQVQTPNQVGSYLLASDQRHRLEGLESQQTSERQQQYNLIKNRETNYYETQSTKDKYADDKEEWPRVQKYCKTQCQLHCPIGCDQQSLAGDAKKFFSVSGA